MEELKKVFDEYVEKFEPTDKIKLKYEHTLRVADNCFKIAEFLNISEMDKKIAYLMGLSQDLGRFKNMNKDSSPDISHNKDSIDKNLGERTKMFASILRDADKLDILYILTFEEKENIFWFNEYDAL